MLLAAGLWGAGFAWFCIDALNPVPPSIPCGGRCDGIVALTGGRDRIEASLALLARGAGRELLISGVDPHATLAQLTGRSPVSLTPELASRITLGRRAVSTIGNGVETATWATRNRIHSLIVVTAGYHIRRAMIELHRAAPTLALHPYPIRSPVSRRAPDRATLRLLLQEYMKWIGSHLGLSRGVNLTPKT
ncbi:YdcF family protein [Swaminathania salitolerans]|uniref:YdcF family protein n=1 Tax=Swaminathania salitolerans TaxID=182838 RepID=UPI001FE400AB|nr:YdcF family protein [Swaminathania salitolerans]